MKIFISGPISGVENYRAVFADAEEALKEKGHIVVNPAYLPEDLPWEAAMVICEAAVSVCDAIVQLPGWERSVGALSERVAALKAQKRVYETIGDVPNATMGGVSDD